MMRDASQGVCAPHLDHDLNPCERRSPYAGRRVAAPAASFQAMRAVLLPPPWGRSGLQGAFAAFRLALLADQVGRGAGAARNGISNRDLMHAVNQLAGARCLGAGDFALKALAARVLVNYVAGYSARSAASEAMREAEAIADLFAGLAADALQLLAPGGQNHAA